MFESEGEGEGEVGIEAADVEGGDAPAEGENAPPAEPEAKPAAEKAPEAKPPAPTPFERLSKVLEAEGMKELVGIDADIEVTPEWLAAQPTEVRARFASILKAAISQGPDVAAAEKKVAEARARAEAARTHELKSRAAVGKLADGPAVRAEMERLKKVAGGEPIDPDIDPAGYVERESAKASLQVLQTFLGALGKDAEEARAAAEAEAQRAAHQAYVDQHREDMLQEMTGLDGKVARTFDVVRDLVINDGIPLERAHKMAQRMRAGAAPPGRPNNVGPSHLAGEGPDRPPAGLTLQQENAWYEANPAAMRRFLQKMGSSVSAR